MNCVNRVYVEKKSGFDIEANHAYHDLKEHLHLNALDKVRIIHRYDVSGLDYEPFQRAVDSVFSEPAVDQIFDELDDSQAIFFAVEYLPGQFDQRADSAVQCIQLIHNGPRPLVRYAKVYGLYGQLTDAEVQRIKEYIINPVDSHEATLAPYETLDVILEEPQDVAIMDGFIQMDDQQAAQLKATMGLAMSVEDVIFVRDYFHSKDRQPSITEIKVIDTYWSDHCRHTTFLTQLDDIEIEDSVFLQRAKATLADYRSAREEVYGSRIHEKSECLMDIATMGVKLLNKRGLLHDLDESEEINACSIKIDVDVDGAVEPWLLMFKNETHNHPTEIEPFGGAATCLGGAIRDPLSGRSYVYQAMRVTGAGDPRGDVSDHLPGKLPQRTITTVAAHGYSSYGNQIGLATGQVVEIYDPGYVAKRMEIGAVIAAAPASNVVRERPVAGDVVVLLGGATGRDGCGGATGSSKAHDISSIDSCGAEVQKGNPPTERKLQRLFRNPDASTLIKRCNDFGAGGVCVAIGELAEGLLIDLDQVPKKYDGLDGTELAISESQERMAVVLEAQDVEKFKALAEQENLIAVKVADVTDSGRLVMTWRGKVCLDIDRSFLDTNGAAQHAKATIASPDADQSPFIQPIVDDVKSAWLQQISQLNTCIQRGLSERFDATIGAGSVLMPFGGRNQLTPTQAMAAKIPVLHGETSTASIMSFGFSPEIYRFSPYHGAVYAVLESLLRITCTGGDMTKVRLTFQEYFERLRNDRTRWGKPLAALLGAFDVQQALGIPAIGGKDSMSGSFEELDVVPTLVSFAVVAENAKNIISPEFKDAHHTVGLLKLDIGPDGLPDYVQFARHCNALYQAIQAGQVVAAHTITSGGIAEAVSKMAVGNDIGVELTLSGQDLLSPFYGSVIFEYCGEDMMEVFKGCHVSEIGQTNSSGLLQAGGVQLSIAEAKAALTGVLEDVFPVSPGTVDRSAENVTYTQRNTSKPVMTSAKPKVLIPVFPGTNCEYDSQRAFEHAGADAEIFVFRNYNPQVIAESIEVMAQKIKQSQMIMLPGGFSLGDEPEGSGKFIATVLSNPQIADHVMDLLKNRDGLMLGICNGFQALVKVGLVPYGEIRPMQDHAPTLTFNDIGRHQSRIIQTRVASVLSPWMAGVNAGDINHVAISHGEGRFVCTPEDYSTMVSNGQIATQYVNASGQATYDIDFNPNGSFHAVEGITSPDGRVLGKMGHNERMGQWVYKNVNGHYDSRIFESGVKYFK